MSKSTNMLLAGFGGQGILFLGKVIAYAGLIEGLEVSWLPSYGPEMRGGTANCSVCISEQAIGSPLVTAPDVLAVMNLPSYDKFIDTVTPGGTVIVDRSLIPKKCDRTDINVYYIDATALSNSENLTGLANIIMVGKLFKETGFTSRESFFAALEKSVPKTKAHLLEANKRAVELGMSL